MRRHVYHDISHVGFDADDTLWHSENRFQDVHRRYHELLSAHVDLSVAELEARMLVTEQRNLRLFGYGAKGFILSLIETAIEVTDRSIPASDIEEMIAFGKELLDHPVELLPGAAETVQRLRDDGFALLLITKGDLWHQESKVAASGIGDHFGALEIMAEKDPDRYREVLDRHGIEPSRFCMVGNSVRSDVLPALDIGAAAIHVPYELVWAHEAVDDTGGAEFVTVESLRDVPAHLRR